MVASVSAPSVAGIAARRAPRVRELVPDDDGVGMLRLLPDVQCAVMSPESRAPTFAPGATAGKPSPEPRQESACVPRYATSFCARTCARRNSAVHSHNSVFAVAAAAVLSVRICLSAASGLQPVAADDVSSLRNPTHLSIRRSSYPQLLRHATAWRVRRLLDFTRKSQCFRHADGGAAFALRAGSGFAISLRVGGGAVRWGSVIACEPDPHPPPAPHFTKRTGVR